jgi:hypothetical protein
MQDMHSTFLRNLGIAGEGAGGPTSTTSNSNAVFNRTSPEDRSATEESRPHDPVVAPVTEQAPVSRKRKVPSPDEARGASKKRKITKQASPVVLGTSPKRLQSVQERPARGEEIVDKQPRLTIALRGLSNPANKDSASISRKGKKKAGTEKLKLKRQGDKRVPTSRTSAKPSSTKSAPRDIQPIVSLVFEDLPPAHSTRRRLPLFPPPPLYPAKPLKHLLGPCAKETYETWTTPTTGPDYISVGPHAAWAFLFGSEMPFMTWRNDLGWKSEFKGHSGKGIGYDGKDVDVLDGWFRREEVPGHEELILKEYWDPLERVYIRVC